MEGKSPINLNDHLQTHLQSRACQTRIWQIKSISQPQQAFRKFVSSTPEASHSKRPNTGRTGGLKKPLPKSTPKNPLLSVSWKENRVSQNRNCIPQDMSANARAPPINALAVHKSIAKPQQRIASSPILRNENKPTSKPLPIAHHFLCMLSPPKSRSLPLLNAFHCTRKFGKTQKRKRLITSLVANREHSGSPYVFF